MGSPLLRPLPNSNRRVEGPGLQRRMEAQGRIFAFYISIVNCKDRTAFTLRLGGILALEIKKTPVTKADEKSSAGTPPSGASREDGAHGENAFAMAFLLEASYTGFQQIVQ